MTWTSQSVNQVWGNCDGITNKFRGCSYPGFNPFSSSSKDLKLPYMPKITVTRELPQRFVRKWFFCIIDWGSLCFGGGQSSSRSDEAAGLITRAFGACNRTVPEIAGSVIVGSGCRFGQCDDKQMLRDAAEFRRDPQQQRVSRLQTLPCPSPPAA